jgi:hypothetical protein
MEKHNKDLENIRMERDSFVENFKGDRCQLLELEGKEGYFKCKAQQTS